MQPYEQLAAWQRAHAMTLVVYRVTESWPTSERYNLTAQTRRASVSVPANIAEGSAKRGSVSSGVISILRSAPWLR
jgi:four helix bundle protein